MNNQAKQWTLVVVAFIAGLGVSHLCSQRVCRSDADAKQAEWVDKARQRFAGPRAQGNLGRPAPQQEKGKGKRGRKKGEGGPE
tara:strand:- start:57 stop:305 length:249 start_codon:yes stop_codon:yes gene_type:complete